MLPLPFLWLPQIGKCCRRRFASFPVLGRFAYTVWEISQGWEHLWALSELFPNIGMDFLSIQSFPKAGKQFSTFYLQFIALVEPHFGRCIAGHSPIATRTKANATHFRPIGQARTLELLGEETTEENP